MNEELEKLELQRKKCYQKKKIFGLIAAGFLALGIFLFILLPYSAKIGAFFVLIIGVVLLIVSISIGSNIKNEFKNTVVKTVVKETLGDDAIYDPKRGIPVKEICSLGLVKRPDRYHLEDYIEGTYNGLRFAMCDMNLEEEHVTSNGKTTTVTYVSYFKGKAIKIDFKRDFNEYFKIVPKSLFNFTNLTKVETEVIDFNKKFEVFTNNKENIFYFLTPNFINKIMVMNKMFRGTILYCMNGDCFYVLINDSSDSLEFSFSKPINEQTIKELESQINLGPAIINEFNLDNDKYNNTDIKGTIINE